MGNLFMIFLKEVENPGNPIVFVCIGIPVP